MFTLDYQSRLPIYEQLYKSIIKMASLGVMEPNEKLLLCEYWDSSWRQSQYSAKGVSNVERDQIIYSIPGKGSFISPDLSSVDVKSQRHWKRWLWR
ncbi:MAG: hypothetical protein ACLSCV_08015 [Acutalibacteraceae bacterium]